MCCSVHGQIKLSLRSGGCDAVEDGFESVDARNQLYMSLAPRFLMFVRDVLKVLRWAESDANAARSARRIPGWSLILPRRTTRRPV